MPSETDRFPYENRPEIAVPCCDIDLSLTFYLDKLGFRLLKIFPADRPRVAVVEKDGLRLRLTADVYPTSVIRLRMPGDPPPDAASESPEGIPIEYASPPGSVDFRAIGERLIFSEAGDKLSWQSGRAGMLYRDLIPDRIGGCLIASHIRIPYGGPVPDYVHYHQVDLQIIYCLKGEALLVYEDQGEPFRFLAGDCVLQPPGIRHRVLECSDGFEVVEISSPAEHPTFAEYEIELPTSEYRPDRQFEGQRFLHHADSTTDWADWIFDGFRRKRTAIGDASSGKADVSIVGSSGTAAAPIDLHGLFPMFLYILSGEMTIDDQHGSIVRAGKGASCFAAGNHQISAKDFSEDLEFLLLEFARDSGFGT